MIPLLSSFKRIPDVNKILIQNLLTRYNSVRNYRFTASMSRKDQVLSDPIEPFKPKTALVLHKFSRYEYEKRRFPNLSETALKKILENRGSEYESLKRHHAIHSEHREHIIEALKSFGIEARLVNRFDYNEENINWAEMVVTSGGDGTFLMAASKVNNSNKPLIGVNSDPQRSVGHLCLPNRYSSHFDEALRLLSEGHFKWKYRQRIRVTLQSEDAFEEPIELHNQHLKSPENRFLDMDSIKTESLSEFQDSKPKNKHLKDRVLPFRALNEVFVGESLSSRVSYYEFSVNSKQKVKLKSSGITICTGTGSTSWSFNINKVTPQCVQTLFKIINEETNGLDLSTNDTQLIERVTQKFNTNLIFDPSEVAMAYTIRDPVVFGTDFNSNPRDFAKKIEIRSRMSEANIVIDGGLSYKFNDGSNAMFEILEEDALKTVFLEE